MKSLKESLLNSQKHSINESYKPSGSEIYYNFHNLLHGGKCNPENFKKYIPSNELQSKPWICDIVSMYIQYLVDATELELDYGMDYSEENPDPEEEWFENEWSDLISTDKFMEDSEFFKSWEKDHVKSTMPSKYEIKKVIKKWVPYIYKKLYRYDIEIPN